LSESKSFKVLYSSRGWRRRGWEEELVEDYKRVEDWKGSWRMNEYTKVEAGEGEDGNL